MSTVGAFVLLLVVFVVLLRWYSRPRRADDDGQSAGAPAPDGGQPAHRARRGDSDRALDAHGNGPAAGPAGSSGFGKGEGKDDGHGSSDGD